MTCPRLTALALLLGFLALPACHTGHPVAPSTRSLAAIARSDAAVSRIKELGGHVLPERQDSGVSLSHADTATTDAALAAAGNLVDLGSICLLDAHPSDGWLARFAGQPHLHFIAVSDAAFSPQEMSSLPDLPALRSLHLIHAGLTDEDLPVLVRFAPKLTSLTLAEDSISDAGVVELGRLTHLRALRLDRVSVTDRAIINLLRVNPWLIVKTEGDRRVFKGAWCGQ